MSKWRNEVAFNSRYAVAGIVNSLIGLSAIAWLSQIGVNPIAANFLGYAIALTIGFIGAKGFVFRSKGHLTVEALRYLVTFAICYVINVAALFICITWFAIDTMTSQGIAVFFYVISMYTASRLFVFAGRRLD